MYRAHHLHVYLPKVSVSSTSFTTVDSFLLKRSSTLGTTSGDDHFQTVQSVIMPRQLKLQTIHLQ